MQLITQKWFNGSGVSCFSCLHCVAAHLNFLFSLLEVHCRCKMVKPPCYDMSKMPVKDGCLPAEDAKRIAYAAKQGTSSWKALPKKAGLRKCGKSCKIRWNGSQSPDAGDDNFTSEEEDLIIKLHSTIGSRWTIIAQQLPGRTDNDVKNLWNTKLKKKLSALGIDPVTHRPFSQILADYGNISGFPKARNRFGCLSRDMKNAFNIKSELYHSPQERPSYFSCHLPSRISPAELDPTQQHFLNNNISASNQPLELLSQLQAITMITEATNYTNTATIPAQQMQSECTSSSASSSSPESPPSAANQATASPIFSWCDFLLEDAYPPANVQELENAIMLPPSELSCSTQIQSCAAAGKEMKMSMKTVEASSTMSSGSFVETMLEGENEMLSEFHGLLEEPFYY